MYNEIMASAGKFIIAGNWKMNGTTQSVAEITSICNNFEEIAGIDAIICPPSTLISLSCEAAKGSGLKIGAQDCVAYNQPYGAFTGGISAQMLGELGASAVICGHSERRENYGETNDLVRKKAEAAIAADLLPIICVGESKEQFLAGKTLARLENQVKESSPENGSFVIAYEPIWAIGTNIPAQPKDIVAAIKHIKNLVPVSVLYGGSVNPKNASSLAQIEEIGGFLVGSASLKANDFLSIINSCKPFYS